MSTAKVANGTHKSASAPKIALQKAIDRAGGQSALASKIGVRQSLVSFWLNQAKEGVAPDKVVAIEEATGVSRYELRPDVYARPVLGRKRQGSEGEEGHFSRYKHIRRDHFKTAKDVQRHIRALREEWSGR